MFTVKPVREKELQEALAKVFGCEYFPDSYAFLAGNSDDGETLTSLLGFSQFMMNSDRDAVILNVTPAPNYYDEEVNDATDRITALIEPCIILILAVFVAIIVFSIFLPMMNMTKAYDQYL